MIRLFHAYFPVRTVLLSLTEAILLAAGFLLAVLITAGTPVNADIFLLYENGIARIALVVAVVLTLIYYFDLYDAFVLTNRREVFTRLVGVLGCTLLALGFLYYTFPAVHLSGTVLWVGILLACIALPAWRECFFFLNRSARFAEHAVIFGGGALAGLLVDEIRRRPELGVRIDGFVGQGLQFPGMPCVDRQDLAEFIRTKGIRRVLVTMADRRGKLPVDSLLELKAGGIQIQDGSEYYEGITGKIDLDSLRLSWLLFSPGFHVRAPLRFYKRVFSVVLASLALVLLAPLMAVIAIAIRLDSKGPAIFRQARVGENGKIFMMYKFRSMRDGSEKAQLRPAGAEDQRITRLGKWLRPPRLDELPQLINIVKGDMAFVGPRPFVPEQEEEYTTAIPFYRQRWLVKPGATGWAQINRGYNVTLEDNREKLSYDLFYIKNISVGLDLYILLATAKILLLGRGGRLFRWPAGHQLYLDIPCHQQR